MTAMLTSNKELRRILKEAEANGWVFSRGRKHIKGKHTSGKTTAMAVTPSDHRALLNIQKALKV